MDCPVRLLIEEFLENKGKRLFFIQWKYQVRGHATSPHCCEPQIMLHLKALFKKLQLSNDAESKVDWYHLARFIEMHMMLEQDPCTICRKEILPAIRSQLGSRDLKIPLQPVVSMLKYRKNSVFLKRLTKEGGPVQLKADLRPFQERHVCSDYERCIVRCHKDYHYSNPSKVLAVDDRMLRFAREHSRARQTNSRKPRHPKLHYRTSNECRENEHYPKVQYIATRVKRRQQPHPKLHSKTSKKHRGRPHHNKVLQQRINKTDKRKQTHHPKLHNRIGNESRRTPCHPLAHCRHSQQHRGKPNRGDLRFISKAKRANRLPYKRT